MPGCVATSCSVTKQEEPRPALRHETHVSRRHVSPFNGMQYDKRNTITVNNSPFEAAQLGFLQSSTRTRHDGTAGNRSHRFFTGQRIGNHLRAKRSTKSTVGLPN